MSKQWKEKQSQNKIRQKRSRKKKKTKKQNKFYIQTILVKSFYYRFVDLMLNDISVLMISFVWTQRICVHDEFTVYMWYCECMFLFLVHSSERYKCSSPIHIGRNSKIFENFLDQLYFVFSFFFLDFILVLFSASVFSSSGVLIYARKSILFQ